MSHEYYIPFTELCDKIIIYLGIMRWLRSSGVIWSWPDIRNGAMWGCLSSHQTACAVKGYGVNR